MQNYTYSLNVKGSAEMLIIKYKYFIILSTSPTVQYPSVNATHKVLPAFSLDSPPLFSQSTGLYKDKLALDQRRAKIHLH